MSKCLLNSVKNKLEEKIEEYINHGQFSFKKEIETREAILYLKQILDRRTD